MKEQLHPISKLVRAGSAVGLAITLNFGAGLIEAGSPTPTSTSTATATPTNTPTGTATATPTLNPFAPLREVIKSVRDLKEFNNELNDVFSSSSKDSRPQAQQAPTPVILEPKIVEPKVVVVQPQQPAQDSEERGVRLAMAIETITQGRINEIVSATARAAYPTPYSTPRPVQVEILSPATPINIRITEDRGLPWWQTVLLAIGGVGIGAGIFARRRIITFIHNHTAPAPPAPPRPLINF